MPAARTVALRVCGGLGTETIRQTGLNCSFCFYFLTSGVYAPDIRPIALTSFDSGCLLDFSKQSTLYLPDSLIFVVQPGNQLI